MGDYDVSHYLFAFGVLTVGSICLGVARLAGRFADPITAILGTVFLIAGIVQFCMDDPIWSWATPAAIGMLGLTSVGAARWRERLLTGLRICCSARAAHGALLISTGPLIAVLLAYQLDEQSSAQAMFAVELVDLYKEGLSPTDQSGRTDRGLAIPLYASDASAEIDAVLAQSEEGIIRQRQLQLIRLEKSGKQSNCHGWVFAAGQFCIKGTDVDAILRDNNYTVCSSPRVNDIIVYRNHQGHVLHTGVVHSVSRNMVLIASKWGMLDVYLHRPEDQNYSQTWEFYSTSRSDHRLVMD